MSSQELKANHLRNLAWAMLDDLTEDIVRIAEQMAPVCRDEAITQKTLLAVGGLLLQRRAEAKQLEGTGE